MAISNDEKNRDLKQSKIKESVDVLMRSGRDRDFRF